MRKQTYNQFFSSNPSGSEKQDYLEDLVKNDPSDTHKIWLAENGYLYWLAENDLFGWLTRKERYRHLLTKHPFFFRKLVNTHFWWLAENGYLNRLCKDDEYLKRLVSIEKYRKKILRERYTLRHKAVQEGYVFQMAEMGLIRWLYKKHYLFPPYLSRKQAIALLARQELHSQLTRTQKAKVKKAFWL